MASLPSTLPAPRARRRSSGGPDRDHAGEVLSLAQARRIALAAQGFTDPAPRGAVARRHLRRVLDRLGLVQMDSVNVLQRAHYLPLYSRLGPYPTSLLDRAAYRPPRALFEYWGHEASLIRVDLHPALRWRMARAHQHAWGGCAGSRRSSRSWSTWVRDEVAAAGAADARPRSSTTCPAGTEQLGVELVGGQAGAGVAVLGGEVTAAERTGAFARVYDLPERVLPARGARHAPRPTDAEAYRLLVAHRRPVARGGGRAGAAGLLPAAGGRVPAGGRGAGRGRGAGAGTGGGAGASRLGCTPGPASPLGPGDDAAQPVRPVDLGTGPHRAAVRLQLPDRDLRAGSRAGCTATTSCRSCRGTGSPPGST